MDNSKDITIRPLRPDEWQDLFRMRLKAVTDHPGYFMATPEHTKSHPPELWKKRISGEGQCVFGLFDQLNLIGITGIFTDREYDPSGATAHLVMSYIEPEYRGRGFSDLFYKARIEWARNQPHLKKLTTGHREGNEPSRRAMLRQGFQLIDKKLIDWPDGTQDLEYIYELTLKN